MRYGSLSGNAGGAFHGRKTKSKVFHLPVTGIVDFKTWYKIQEIYVSVTRIVELRDSRFGGFMHAGSVQLRRKEF